MSDKALENLSGTDALFSSVVNQIPVGIVECDLAGRLVLVNDKFCEIVGYTREELHGMNIPELTHPDDSAHSLKLFQKCVADGEPFTIEKRYVRKNGSEVWVKNSVSLLRGDADKPQFALAVVTDITDEKQAQNALLQSESRYRALIDASAQTIVTMNAEGSRDLHREWFSRLTGVPLEELRENRYLEVIHPDDREYLQKVMSQLMQNPKPYEVELRLLPKDSENYRFYNLRGVPVFNAGGALSEWIGAITDITDRREAEIAKREIDKAQAHLAAIIESSDDAIISKDLNGIITSWNKGAEKMFGYTAEEVIGKSIAILMPPQLVGEEPQILRRIKRGESFEHYETQRRCKDGRDIDISLTISPIRDSSGNIVGASKIGRDITERKEAEEALRESQAILSLSMRSSRMGAWVQDIKTDYVWWSEELEEIFGLKKGSFASNRNGFYEYVHPDDRRRIIAEVQQAIKEHRDYTIEFRFLHADGSTRWMEGRGQAFYSEKGEVVRLYGIGIDITERRQIQEQLLKAERRAAEDYQALLARIVSLAQTLGTARDLISVYRSVGDFVRSSTPCNAFFVSFYDAETNLRTAAYVSGEEGEVDVSTLPPMLLTPDGGPNSQAVFQKRTVIVNRYMDLMKDRPHIILQEDGIDPMSSLVVPMTVMNRIIGTLEIQAYEDDAFTQEHIVALEMVGNLAAVAIENVRLLQVEERARQEAETANRAKDEFLSVLSHELRTPLNSMFGWTRMLRSGILDEEKTRQAVEVIERNVRLQNSLIEDMLDVSRIITGKMRIDKAETDFAAIVKSAVEAVRPQAEQKKVSLVFSADADAYVLLGDEVRLQQIVSNLINNAVKFTPEDGAVILSLSTIADGAVLLNVTDTGIGIEPDFLPQIFDRFRQADSTTRRAHSGLGLGLTIVRHLTELHGGRVSAESEGIGKGASFSIELPLLPKPQNDSIDNNAAVENDSGHSLKGAQILLVDDDCDAMMPLQIILETHEAEVFCASSVGEALEKLAQEKFNLLVSDIGMPEMDGYDLITALRKMDASSNHDIPAIALTAYASTQDKRRALMSGFQHHFAKPLDFEQFLTTVYSLIAHSKNK